MARNTIGSWSIDEPSPGVLTVYCEDNGYCESFSTYEDAAKVANRHLLMEPRQFDHLTYIQKPA